MKNTINTFTEFMSVEITRSNIKGANPTLKALQQYKQDILFSDLNNELLSDFERSLYSTQETSIDAILEYFSHIETFVSIAIDKGLFESKDNPFLTFTAKSSDQAITEDLKKIVW